MIGVPAGSPRIFAYCPFLGKATLHFSSCSLPFMFQVDFESFLFICFVGRFSRLEDTGRLLWICGSVSWQFRFAFGKASGSWGVRSHFWNDHQAGQPFKPNCLSFNLGHMFDVWYVKFAVVAIFLVPLVNPFSGRNCRHGPQGPILETAALPEPFAHCIVNPGRSETSASSALPDKAFTGKHQLLLVSNT